MLRASHVDVDGTRLHLVCGGQGDPVLFLHGAAAFWYAWRRQLPALAATHRVLAVDLPGCNLSPADPRALDRERLADLVAALLKQVAPGRRAVLVGEGVGGAVAWEVAARHPAIVDRVVAIGAPPPALLARAGGLRGALAPDAGPDALAAHLFDASPEGFGPAERAAYHQAWSRPGARPALDEARLWAADPDAAPMILAPALVLCGDGDDRLPAGCLDALDEVAPEATVERLPGRRPLHEAPERVGESIRRFLTPRRLTFEEPVFDVLSERELWRRHPDYNCFWAGPDNPRGLQLTPRIEAGRVSVRMTVGRDHSGVVGLAHGGIVFTVLDGLMGWLIMSHLGRLGLTSQATVEYLAPVHVGGEYEFEAVPDPDAPVTPRQVRVLSRVYPVGQPDRVCARARATFVLPTREKAERVLGREIDVSPELFG